MENNQKENVLYVNMLGNFSITYNGKTISDEKQQTKKPWNMLSFLIMFRNQELSHDDLIQLIWSDDRSKNSASALKTLLFRIRQMLVPLGIPPQNLVLQTHGSYAWTTEIETILDIDLFEERCLKASQDETLSEESLKNCLKAIDLYKGHFFPKLEWESWVIPFSSYYHSLYQKVIHKTISILSAQNDFQEIIKLCEKSLPIEPFDEELHYALINALYQSGKQTIAIKHYSKTIDKFYNEFGITPSDRLKELYKTIRNEKHEVTTDLNAIHEALMDKFNAKGAFLCEPSIFKDIYQLEARVIERTGDSIYLCLLTISQKDGSIPKSASLVRVMKDFNEIIYDSLRRGDVYSRYSLSQFVILLPTTTLEYGDLVLKRIVSNFKKHYNHKNIQVTYALQPLPPSTPNTQPHFDL